MPYRGWVRIHLSILLLLLASSCDKTASTEPRSDSKLLGERLIAEFGEGYLSSPELIVYDSGYIVGRGNRDPEFSAKIAKLQVRPASSLSSGRSPLDTHEFYSQEGVEFGISDPDKFVVVDSTSSLAIRLLYGQPGIRALRTCEAILLDRVCKVGGELRARIDDAPVVGASIVDAGTEVAKGEVRRGWVVFASPPDFGDRAELDLELPDGVRCNLSKWLVDPRDSCAM